MKALCKLCGLSSELRNSHITPDFYITNLESMKETGAHGDAHPHSYVASTQPNFVGGWKQRNYWEKKIGWKEYLLCGDCEQRIGAHEGKIRRFLYGNAPQPLKKQLLGTKKSDFIPSDGFIEVREVEIDYRELKLYQLSLLWRAGIASGEFFDNVFLGTKHEKRLRELLVNDNPGTEYDYPCMMCDLRSNVDLVGYSEKPTKGDENGKRTYKIIIGGYAFLYSMSTGTPSPRFCQYSAKQNGKMLLLVYNGEHLLLNCAARLKKAGKITTSMFRSGPSHRA